MLTENFVREMKKTIEEVRPLSLTGNVADYIPALKKSDPSMVACSIFTKDGACHRFGDVGTTFTIQSVSKVLTLALAIEDRGKEYVFERVGMEPTGDPYYSMARLELTDQSKPLNPMINAGALTITSMIKGNTKEEKFERILHFIRELADDEDITYNEDVAQSEYDTTDKNRALAYYLKANNILEGDIDEVIDIYTKQCSIEMSCCHLARIGQVLGNRGYSTLHEKELVSPRIAQLVKTFMVTCGMYNSSGQLAIEAGIPSKSGVSGAILGTLPGGIGIGIYSPALDEKGNSVVGIELLKRISQNYDLSIF
ncbi:glutaminase A [Geomicrobium sp. JCM 19038]|uniref:glutaminase A n=1 Tax=Geomicrobium sp. JCM 19038 TaxID=1460635 RepID=UPI00045F1A22|nr:glutaminase A [Geomicrobium sp. JCM 19038]GAK07382.1 glutaminase [Geomicrobium sp. JCM 19038]